MQAECAAGLRSAGRMAAWRLHAYGGPHELQLDAARVPPLRSPTDVRVRVHQASINPLDVAMTSGYGARVLNTLRALTGGDGMEFPLVPGRDFVGEVEAAGPRATLRPGARVWGVVPPHRPGAHADYVVVDQRWVGPAPRTMGAEAGGALYAALSASAALRCAGVWGEGGARGGTRGEGGARVLLLGLGGVGHAALQLLVHHNAEVVVGCSGALCPRARSLGAAAALDRRAPGYDRALEDAGPYEAIIDCAGVGGQEAGARRWRFKRFVTLSTPLLAATDRRGLLAGGAAAAAELAAQCWRAASGAASGAAGGPACPPHVRWAYFTPRADDIELLRRLAERGQFTVAVEDVFAWRRARAAYERAASGAARGKLLLDFMDDAA